MKNNKLKIIYEDKYLLIINKKDHLLTIANSKEKERTLYHEVYLYQKKQNKNNKVFIIHRLDFDTSGLVIFAKDIKTKTILQDNWEKVIRKYMAICEGEVLKDSDTLKAYLKETNTNLVYITKDNSGLLAITKYKKILSNKKYSLLDIEIKTGRKNQIRVMLSNINHPILGDKKYGSKEKVSRMYLHAYYLKFKHPITNQDLEFELDIPKDFSNIINKM